MTSFDMQPKPLHQCATCALEGPDPCVPSRAGKDTVQILAHLQAAYPEAITPQHTALHDLLGATNERITGTAISLLAAGDAAGLGTASSQMVITFA